MKKIYLSLFLFLVFAQVNQSVAQTNSVALIPTVGPQFFYPSITSAYAAIPASPSSSFVIELLPTYDGTDASEVYPILFSDKGLTPGGAVTITIRPSVASVGKIIQRPSAAVTFTPVVSFDGGDNVILDGRPGGVTTGVTTSYLTVSQPFTTTTALPAGSLFRAIDFVNSANNNTVQYVNATAAAANTTTGAQVVVIGSTTTTGNNNNKILNSIVSGGARGIQDFGLSTAVPNNGTVIQGNTVKDYSGIGIFAGTQTNITIVANTLQITGTALLGTSVEGIRQQASSGTGTITDNNISLVTTSATITTIQGFINVGTGSENILRNNITAISGPGATTLRGINISNTGVGTTVNISQNTVTNMSGAASTSTIAIANAGTASVNITQNTINSISATTSAIGVNISTTAITPSPTITASQNKISNLSGTAAGNIRGFAIFPAAGATINLYNNFVSITEANATAAAIFGILYGNTASANYTSNSYYNTVRIGGTGSTTSVTSYGIYRSDANATSVFNFKSNISLMDRDGGIAFYNSNATGVFAIDYNTYYATAATSYAAGWVSATTYYTTAQLSAYKAAATPSDANTTFASVNFVSATDLHLTGASTTDAALKSTVIAGLTTDIDGQTRVGTTPTKGADEPNITAPVTFVNFFGQVKNSYNLLSWSTVTENNNKGFEIQKSADGIDFKALGFVASQAPNGTSTSQLSYSINDTKPFTTNSYYRLKQIDKDGSSNYSTIVLLKGKGVVKVEITNLYPNPVNNQFNLVVAAATKSSIAVTVNDASGKAVIQQTFTINAGDNILPMNATSLSHGTYLISVKDQSTGEVTTMKFTK